MGFFDSSSSTSKNQTNAYDGRGEFGAGLGVTNPQNSPVAQNAPALSFNSGKRTDVGSVYISTQDISQPLVQGAFDLLGGAFDSALDTVAGGLVQSNQFATAALSQGFAAGKSADERSSGRVLYVVGAIAIVALLARKVKW